MAQPLQPSIKRSIAVALSLVLLAALAVAAASPAQADGPVFSDDFESGGFANWTRVNGLVVQSDERLDGTYAARNAASTAWAFRALDATYDELYFRVWFKLVSHSTAVTLLRLRTEAGPSILQVFVTRAGKLAYRNDVAGTRAVSSTVVGTGGWHDVQVRVRVAGSNGEVAVWFDDAFVGALGNVENLGSAPIGRLEIGNRPSTRDYDAVWDNAIADTSRIDAFVAPDPDGSGGGSGGFLSSVADEGVFMVDGPVVHDVVVHPGTGNAWIGGTFSEVQNASGSKVASASNLTVLDPSGGLVSSIHTNLPNLTATKPVVFDLSLGPNGVLYAAGKFNYTHGGKSFKNVVGIDPNTGAIVATYNVGAMKSVLATSSHVYAGGKKLWRLGLNGGVAGGGWHQITALVDQSLRGHTISPAFREIELAGDGNLVVVGQFDWIDEKDAAHQKKVAVKVNPANGQPDLGSGSWSVQCSCARQASAAFGLAVEIAGTVVYVAAGGNDWIGAFDLGTGARIWQTDTNGSAQDLAIYDASRLIVGGHWTYIEDDGPNDESGNECPARGVSNPDPCWDQPRLAAISRVDGLPDKSWTPKPCCKYRGVWATTVEGSRVHIGGEFVKLDDAPGPERFYGRFS
jgi:hypothetical protein